jgi:hypothetical protein
MFATLIVSGRRTARKNSDNLLGVPRLVLARARSRGAVREGGGGIEKVCRGNGRKGAENGTDTI